MSLLPLLVVINLVGGFDSGVFLLLELGLLCSLFLLLFLLKRVHFILVVKSSLFSFLFLLFLFVVVGIESRFYVAKNGQTSDYFKNLTYPSRRRSLLVKFVL